MRRLKRLALANAVFGAIIAANTVAFAQAPPTGGPAQFDALFQQMLRTPSNLDVTFRFAELATQQGDYEAAIGALERMLLYNANLPRVKLELGVLYFRLGSYDMAKTYFEAAIAGSDVPADVRAKVEGFLAEIARRTSPDQFSAFAWTGGRYQTNANMAPNNLLVRAIGQEAILGSQFGKLPDWNSFAFGAAGYSHDLGNQRGDTIEAGMVGYFAKQFMAQQFDLGVAEFQVGPRLALFPESISGASLKVYGIVNTVTLGGPQYFNTIGSGVSSRFNVGAFTIVEPSFEYRQRNFFDSANYPTADMQTGHLMTTAIAGEGFVPGWTKWAGRLAYSRNDTQFSSTTYDLLAVDVAIPIEFVTELGETRQWIVTPNAGYSWTNYAGPDWLVDPNVTRRDKEWRLGTTVDTQIHQNIGLRTQVQYQKINSNLPNYTMSNFAVSFGPTLRF